MADISAQFDRLRTGALVKAIKSNGDIDYCLKVEQSPIYHTDGMLADLFSGKLIHYSHYSDLVGVYGSEIQW